jgi:hypothetical protein
MRGHGPVLVAQHGGTSVLQHAGPVVPSERAERSHRHAADAGAMFSNRMRMLTTVRIPRLTVRIDQALQPGL